MGARGKGRGGLFLNRFYSSKWLAFPVLGHKKGPSTINIYNNASIYHKTDYKIDGFFLYIQSKQLILAALNAKCFFNCIEHKKTLIKNELRIGLEIGGFISI